MKTKRSRSWIVFVLSLLISQLLSIAPALSAALPVVDDFESGLPTGSDASGVPIGFVLFEGPSSTVEISTISTPPAPVPGAPPSNTVLKMDVNVTSFGGFTHNFENTAVDAWVSQDWSDYSGLSFWLYGNNSGTSMFLDVLDNRKPGSTTDDAERWTSTFEDNFSGWEEISVDFSGMTRKDIGNLAPNDGFGLTEVYGWSLGTLGTSGLLNYYVDNVILFNGTPVPEPATMLLLGTGLVGLAGLRRRFRK